MSNARKKDLIREYRERVVRPGVFAVRCAADQKLWTGASRDLDSQQNGIWFQLRMGNHMNRALQQSWNSHGPDGFAFEILEVIVDENPEMIDLLLQDREAQWRQESGAAKLFA